MSLTVAIRKVFLLFLSFFLVIGCNSNDPKKDTNTSKYYKINLFPEQEKENISDVMSLEEAINKSEKVVLTDNLQLIDFSSKARSVKEFYLYKIYNSKIVKSKQISSKVKTKADTTRSFYFYSDKKLSFDTTKKDSIYVFLEVNKDKKIISQKYSISYNGLKGSSIILKK